MAGSRVTVARPLLSALTEDPVPGELAQAEAGPHAPFEAATLDLADGRWSEPVLPGVAYESIDTFSLGCAGPDVVAVPDEPPMGEGAAYATYRFVGDRGRWAELPAPPIDLEEGSALGEAGDGLVVVGTRPGVGGAHLDAEGRWQRFAVDVGGVEPVVAVVASDQVVAVLEADGRVVTGRVS
jgi:hypothetical protein